MQGIQQYYICQPHSNFPATPWSTTFQHCFTTSSREDILKNHLNPTLTGKTVTAKGTKLNSKNFIPQMMAP